MGVDLGLYCPGNPRANAPSGQLQTMSEHHHPALHSRSSMEGRGCVVIGHNQSLQMTGLGKSLPLICQQQPRLNYKRRVYSARMKGIPWVPSLGNRGGCATGPYKTSTTLDHTTKTWSQSSST